MLGVTNSWLGVAGTPRAGSPAVQLLEAGPAKAADEKFKGAREALSRAHRSDTDQRDARRASAQDKLGRLKARLKNLLMFMGGDPKAIARQAAQIAKEIASAAKEYAAAGGQSQSLGAMPATPAAAGEAAPSEDGVEVPSIEPPQKVEAKVLDQPGAPTLPTVTPSEPKDPFMEEAKGLAKLARNVIERAIRRARLEGSPDPALDELRREGKDAEREVEEASREFSDANPSAYAVGMEGGAVAIMAGTPSISVQA